MRIVKQHRRLAVTAGVLSTALAVGAVSMVVAANITGPDTIQDRILNASFTTADAPVQDLDPDTLCPPGSTVTCELWAKEGTIDVGGSVGTVKVWGYATSATGAPLVPGPTIVATKGDTVTITVHNDLPVSGVAGDALGLSVRSMSASSQTVPVGGVATYSFVASSAGTTVYSADAQSPTGNRQIAMGLAGVLVVDPDPASCALGDPAEFLGCAYGDPQTLGDGSIGYDVATDSYHGQALIATNEIDLALANAPDPMTFDMTNYQPTVHLINGKAYPDTQVIDGQPGHNVLVRYANLGLADHSMGLVGAYQRTIGRDGVALGSGSDDVTVPLNVGQTADVMVRIPIGARAGFRYALADQALEPGAQSADAAMTFLAVWGPAADPTRPTGEVFIADGGDEISGATALPFTYTMPAGATDARWSVDDPGVTTFPLDGSGTDGAIDTGVLATLVNGSHILWVEWSDDGGATWGAPSGIAFTIDRAGPVVSPVDVDPVYANGIAETTTDIAIGATADSTLTGTGQVAGAVWSIDSCATSAGTAMDSNGPAGIVALTGTVPDATVDGLTEGPHAINVQAVDNRGVWSNDGLLTPTPLCGTGTLVIDRGKPTVGAADVTPNDNDGTMGFPTVDSYLPVVRITATVSDPDIGTDPGSGVESVEGFIDDGLQALPITTDMFGTGFLFTAVDGVFDSPTEDVYADIPLASVATLTPGNHDIWIHALDRAGNWGDIGAASTTLRTVNAGPEVTDVIVDGTAVTVTGVAHGTGVMVTAYEYTVTGQAAVQVDILAADQHPYLNADFVLGTALGDEENLSVRILDSTGKWSAAKTAKPTVVGLAVVNLSGNRQRLTGTAVPSAGGAVDRIEWSVGASPAVPGSGTSVNISSTSFTVTRNPHFGAAGSTLWVRANDPAGGWGPATSVVLP